MEKSANAFKGRQHLDAETTNPTENSATSGSDHLNFSRSETTEYMKLVSFVEEFANVVQKQNGFILKRNQGYHILFNESEMSVHFDAIRSGLKNSENKRAGKLLTEKLNAGEINGDSSNIDIWKALITSLEFSGIDFEKIWKILPSNGEEARHTGVWTYNFAESIVLGHTLLVVPVMQHYGPLTPKLNLESLTKKFDQAQPLLVVGMIGDCVKGNFFEDLQDKAKEGDREALSQIETLKSPRRLQQKMHGLFHALLQAREKSGDGLLADATLVGTGAFGGLAKDLAQPCVDSLNVSDLFFDNTKDEVNFFMFPPPKPEELTFERLKYKPSLNPKKGLGSLAARNIVHVVVAGFDPISLVPHGVINRAFSAEGQLSHATDLLYRITDEVGQFVKVGVPAGQAWESPAAFFANEHKYKHEEGYDTVRFVPESVLRTMGIKNGQETHIKLIAKERCPPRAWNGDTFYGWNLNLEETPLKMWQEVLNELPRSKKQKIHR